MNPLGIGERSAADFLVAIDDATGVVVGGGQVRAVGETARELATLVVDPARRGWGVGGALVDALLQREVATGTGLPVFLLCLENRAPWYERAGFEVVRGAELPLGIRLEAAAGQVVGRLVAGQGVVGMRWRDRGGTA